MGWYGTDSGCFLLMSLSLTYRHHSIYYYTCNFYLVGTGGWVCCKTSPTVYTPEDICTGARVWTSAGVRTHARTSRHRKSRQNRSESQEKQIDDVISRQCSARRRRKTFRPSPSLSGRKPHRKDSSSRAFESACACALPTEMCPYRCL